MKKLLNRLLLFGVIGGTFLMTSCGSDDSEDLPAGPTLTVNLTSGNTVTDDTVRLESGEAVQFSVTANAPGGFNTLRVSSFINGTTTPLIDSTRTELGIDAGTTSVTLSTPLMSWTVSGSSDVVILLDFEAVDENSQTAIETVAIKVDGDPGINSYTTVLLGAQGNSAPGFYDAITGTRYTYAQARDNSDGTDSPVDFGYYWGQNNRNTLAAIDDNGLHNVYNAVGLPISGVIAPRNSTRFQTTSLTASQFDAVDTNGELVTNASFDSSLGESSSTNLSEGDVIRFVLDDDRGARFGLVKIVSVDDTNGNGTITIEVKSQVIDNN